MTQKTIKLSDIYVKKSDLHIPTKTSDLTNDGSNGNSPFATLDNISNMPTANTVASNIQMDGTRSAGSLDTYAKADHIHPSDTSKASVNHTHTGWEIVKKTGGSSLEDALVVWLYVNRHTKMCQLRFNHIINSAVPGQYYEWSSLQGWVEDPYKPTIQVSAATNVIGTITVNTYGDIIGRFGERWGHNDDAYINPRTVIASVFWRYTGS